MARKLLRELDDGARLNEVSNQNKNESKKNLDKMLFSVLFVELVHN